MSDFHFVPFAIFPDNNSVIVQLDVFEINK